MARSAGSPVEYLKRSRGLWLAALTILVAALAVAGCGGGDDDDGSATAADSGSVKEAEAVIQPFLAPPENIGTEVVLSKKPPTGKKVVTLSCELDVCQNWREQIANVAKLLGWSSTGIAFDGTPEDTVRKMNDALAENPDGIIINGVPRESYEPAVEAAKAKGVPIVTQMGELEGEVVDPFVAVQYQADKFDLMAEATANWAIADSGGDANALLLAYANFPLSERITDTTKATIDQSCPDCSTKTLRVQAADTGTKLPSAVVSELQRDPNIDYVILQDTSMAAGLFAALREAGVIEDVKVTGNNVTPEYIQAIEEGEALGAMAFSLRAAAYNGVDALARHFVGDPIQDVPLMNQILTKESLGSNPTEDKWENLPPTLEQEYKELWRVG